MDNFLKMFRRGFLHWFTQRTSACFLIAGIISIILFDNFILACFTILIVLIHFEAGVHTIVSDYMHDSKSKLISNVSIDLLIIYLVKTVFVIFIFI